MPRLSLLAALCALVPLSAGSGDPPRGARAGDFLQQVARSYGTEDGLPSADVLDLALDQSGAICAATGAGLARLEGERFEALDPPGVVRAVALAARGPELCFLASGALWSLREGAAERLALLPAGVAEDGVRDLHAGRDLWLASAAGLFRLHAGELVPEHELHALLGSELAVHAVAEDAEGSIAVAGAEAGLFAREHGRWRALVPEAGPRRWLPRPRAVAFDARGALWFASPSGAGALAGGSWRLFAGEDGLPWAGFTALAPAANGAVWMGTDRGAIRFDGERFEYRAGRRWLPLDEIRAAVAMPDGGACFATQSGVGVIELVPMTLAEKARRFEAEIELRHLRTPYGFVHSVNLARPGDRNEWTNADSDNDGLWTAMYGAGQCYAFAATRDPTARSRARRAFEALRFLTLVTQGGEHPAPPGFPARTVLPADGPDPNAGRLERDRVTRETEDARWKLLDPRWPLSADGRWFWKADTSSDELDGHFFFHATYYDLVADTEAEREEVREVVRAIADHLIDHGFRLVDHDGTPTRWGRFAPEDLNRDRDWWEERGLNSLSILSYLKVAEHVTGEQRYRDAARELIDEHGYHLNAMYPKNQAGPGSGNQSDDEMACMGFHDLLRLEDDPELRQVWAYAYWRYWQQEQPERNPLFAFLHAGATRGASWSDSWGVRELEPDGDWLADAIDTLQRYPLDLCDWPQANSHRLDVVARPDHALTGRDSARGHLRDGRALPIDERQVGYWNMDPWTLDRGGEGTALADGSPFLLAYYMGRYFGFLEE